MGIIAPPSKVFFTNVNNLPTPGNSLITYVLIDAQGRSSGQEFVWSDTDNDYVPIGTTAYNVIGIWNASTNTPDYTTTLTTNGDALVVQVAGTTSVNNFDKWNIGDLLVRNNDIYFRIPNQPDITATLTDNTIPVFKNNQFEDSPLTDTTEDVESTKTIQTTAGSIRFSEALSIGSAGEAFALFDEPNGRRGYMIGYERLDDGTGRPFYRKLSAKQSGVTIQGSKDSNTGTQNITIPVTFTANRLITAVTLESTETVTGATISLLRGTTTVETMSNLSFTQDVETTINIPQGLICSSGSVFNIKVEGVILKGTGTVGTDFQLFLKVDNWIWETVNLPDDSNLLTLLQPKILAGTNITLTFDSGADTLTINSTGGSGSMTATEIRDALQTLTGTDRLDSSAVKNLPVARTDEDIRDVVVAMLQAGSGISLTEDDPNNTLTIAATTASFDAPRINNFSIDIASRVDLNTDLNVSHTITYDVLHFGSIQSLTLDVQNGTNQALTVPTQDGLSQTQSVTLAGINTATETSVVFKITGVDTQGNNFESNDYTVSVRTLDEHEYIYYGFSTSNNPDTVDVSTLTSREAATESFTVNFGPSTTEGEYNIILAPSDHLLNALTDSLNINQLTPPTSWVTTSNVRTIGTTQYTSYVLGPLAQGYTATLTLEVS